MTHSISLSDDRYNKLIEAAKERGFKIQRGPGSQLGEFIEEMIKFQPVKDYNTIFDGLRSIGLNISSDETDGECWHYQWKRSRIVRGFSTPEAALIAAIQSLQ